MDSYLNQIKPKGLGFDLTDDEIHERVRRFDAWKKPALDSGREIYSQDEINANGNMKPERSDEQVIKTLLGLKVIPAKDWDRMVRWGGFSGEGTGIERTGVDEISLVRNKKHKRTLPHQDPKDFDCYDHSAPVVEERDGYKLVRADREIFKRNKAAKQKRDSARESAKGHDWKKESPAVQALARLAGLLED